MKAPFKLRNQRAHPAKVGALALAIGLPGLLPATAQQIAPLPIVPIVTQATTSTPAAPATTPATTATPASAPPPATAPPTSAAYLTATDSETTVPDYTNWVTLGGGGAFVSGDNGAYKHQQNTNNGPFGGVQDFHWQTFVGKSGTFTMDGHAMFGNHDYGFKLDLTDPNLGYIRAGYSDYRIWYDGTGGYYPKNGLSFQPYDNELYIDRRNAWVEAGLTLPDLPAFIFRYEYDSREGDMDSTSWGLTTLTPGGVSASIVPSFLGIDETRNIFSGDVKDKIDDTDADLGVRYEIDRTADSLYVDENPDQPTVNRYVTENDDEEDKSFSVHGSTMTIFDQKITFSSGFSVTTMDTSLGGSQVAGPAYNASFSPTYPNSQARDEGFYNLSGGGNTKDYVGNLNLMLTPLPNLVIVPSARVEYEGTNLSDTYDSTSVATTGGPAVSTAESAVTDNWYFDVAQVLEARYTGFRDWSLYNSAEVSEDWGNEAWNAVPVLDQVNLNQDWSMLGFKYTAGANWYPLPQLNFGGQYYHEIHDYRYTNNLNPSLIQYPGYLRKQNFTTDDMNIRATWQALSTVSLVTRYDLQYSTVDTWSIPNGGTQAGGIESSNLVDHILSENVNWSPLACLYLQVGGSYVINSLDTPVAGSAGINNLVLNGQNNYWTLDASLGYEIDAKTHLQLQYDYYNADDYFNSAPTSLPYGADQVENSVTATLTRQINKEVSVSVKYGFYRNRDETSGGLDNYDAQLVYVSTQFGF